MTMNRENNKHFKINDILNHLPYLSGVLYFMVCLIVYTYNLSYCRYFNIPLEYISFALSNNILVAIFYYFALTLLLFICYFVVSLMNKISINNIGVINKCLSFILSCILIFLIVILSLTMYFNVILDSMPINILCYLFKDSNGNKTTIVLLLFSVIITICCGIMELISPFKVYNIKSQRKNNIKDSFMQKLNIFWENKSKRDRIQIIIY